MVLHREYPSLGFSLKPKNENQFFARSFQAFSWKCEKEMSKNFTKKLRTRYWMSSILMYFRFFKNSRIQTKYWQSTKIFNQFVKLRNICKTLFKPRNFFFGCKMYKVRSFCRDRRWNLISNTYIILLRKITVQSFYVLLGLNYRFNHCW